MNEMDVQTVDLGDELVETVQRRFPRPPVVAVCPILGQLAGVRQRDALTPVIHAFGLRPSGPPQSRPQIVENLVRYGYPEWFHPFIVTQRDAVTAGC